MTAYYNEIDPQAAQWLRNLIDAGHIAPGVVDERSIEDVQPDEIAGYTQCHFFAGIGVWSYALRLAGWPDDRPVWTGSCPCQPFSAAGKGAGFDDERHLWPAFHWLIEQCRPAVLFGEQVAAKAVDDWLDVVSTDLEGLGFAVGACAFPSAGVGAPHIRDRTYFMAYALRAGSLPCALAGIHSGEEGAGPRDGELERLGATVELADAESDGYERSGQFGESSGRDGAAHIRAAGELADAVQSRRAERGTITGRGQTAGCSGVGELADARAPSAASALADPFDRQLQETWRRSFDGTRQSGSVQEHHRTGPVNGFWRAADWLLCRDQKWRAVRPGSFPLVDGTSGKLGRVRADQERQAENALPRKDRGSRVGRLRAYGNAINARQAKTFIEVGMECLP